MFRHYTKDDAFEAFERVKKFTQDTETWMNREAWNCADYGAGEVFEEIRRFKIIVETLASQRKQEV